MYTVERNSCSCHPETCSHWTWYLVDPEGHSVFGSDKYVKLIEICDRKNTELTNKQQEVTMNKHSKTLAHVEKILSADKSTSIGFHDNQICYLSINGVEFELHSIDDEKLDEILDAIVLLTKHNLIG